MGYKIYWINDCLNVIGNSKFWISGSTFKPKYKFGLWSKKILKVVIKQVVKFFIFSFFYPGKTISIIKNISMTSLLTHTVAHSTRPSYRPKINNQPLKKFLGLAVSWVKVVNNGKILTFKVNFLCQKLSESF